MSLRPLLVATALAAALTGCAAPRASVHPPGAAAAALTPRVLNDTPFERTWDLRLPGPVHTSWVCANSPDLLFVQLAESRQIVAVDAYSGATRWVSQAMPEAIVLAPSITRVRVGGDAKHPVYDERLYVVAHDTLFALDLGSGHIIWRYELPFSPSTGPVAVGVDATLRVYLGDWAGRMQVIGYHQEKGFPFSAWQWPLSTSINAPAVAGDALVYAGDNAGVLHAFKHERAQAWSSVVGGSLSGSPLVRDRVLYAASSDNVLVALNALSGEPLGQLNLGAPVTRTPVAFDGEPQRVYLWTGEADGLQSLVAVRTQPDAIAFTDGGRHPREVVRLGVDWQCPGFEVLVGSSPEYLYGTAKGSTLVQALNRRTGVIDWTWDPATEPGQAPISALVGAIDPSDRLRSLVVVGSDGTVVAHRFFGSLSGTVGATGK